MTTAVAERVGVRHLRALAAHPRPAGGNGEREARAYVTRVLNSHGFHVREEPFTYSAFPGRFATPVAGALLATTIGVATWFAVGGNEPGAAGVALILGVVVTAAFARGMIGGMLTLPLLRASGVNLTATRGSLPPRVWLVAHLDSKSQPVPSLLRVSGVAVLVVGLAMAIAADALTLGGQHVRTLWYVALLAGLSGALPVMASVVGARSHGAVDNASGAASVLAAAAMLRSSTACGVLFTSAEELGLAGARAWLLTHSPAVVLNGDGVDDEGSLVIMFNGQMPAALVNAVRAASTRPSRAQRMPLGLLTDSSAFAAAGWPAVTVSHGSLATLRRVHTSRDTLANLRGDAVDDVARILAHAAEVLAQ